MIVLQKDSYHCITAESLLEIERLCASNPMQHRFWCDPNTLQWQFSELMPREQQLAVLKVLESDSRYQELLEIKKTAKKEKTIGQKMNEFFEERNNEGMKFDQTKIRTDLFPMECFLEVCKVLTFGANKYTDNNWQKLDPERIRAAELRHMAATQTGELRDPETGLLHSAHEACNAIFRLWFDIQAVKEAERAGGKI